MSGIVQILLGVGFFTLIVLALVILILFAKSHLVPSGHVKIIINDDKKHTYEVPIGDKLINTLADRHIYIPSACGGGGTCGQCKVIIEEGGGSLLPTEASIINRREAREGYRLGCQVAVKDDMKLIASMNRAISKEILRAGPVIAKTRMTAL